MATIYISPSTQERNTGYGNYGTEEKRMNQIADVVCKYLDEAKITYYRNKPSMTLNQVIADSNAKKPDIHLAIHSNAGGGTGAECWIYDWGGEHEKFAKIIYNRISKITPMKDRGIKIGPHLAELRSTKAPACLIEIAFHDRKEDAEWIMNNIDLIGTELAKGICDYFGVKHIAEKPTISQGSYYRVRKSWTNAKSQLGAFGVLQNAIDLATKNKGYKVFDDVGKQVFAETVKVPTRANNEFLVRVTASALNVRSGPGAKNKINGTIRDKGTYTIVDTNGSWGRLKSGAGWISLKYTERV